MLKERRIGTGGGILLLIVEALFETPFGLFGSEDLSEVCDTRRQPLLRLQEEQGICEREFLVFSLESFSLTSFGLEGQISNVDLMSESELDEQVVN